MALNVWQPEMMRRWHKYTVVQGVVIVLSRIVTVLLLQFCLEL